MVIAIALSFVLTPVNPIAILKALLVVMWVVVAALYMLWTPNRPERVVLGSGTVLRERFDIYHRLEAPS